MSEHWDYQHWQELWDSREKIAALEKEVADYKEFVGNLLVDRYDVCIFCKHNKSCKGKDCECFDEGDGEIIAPDGVKIASHWTCWEFDYGECDLLRNTPCHGCDFKSGFEWNGRKIVNKD